MSISIQEWHDVRTGEILKVILHPAFFNMNLEEQGKSIKQINNQNLPIPDKPIPAREPKEVYDDKELQKLYYGGHLGYLETHGMDITPQLKKIGANKRMGKGK